MRETGAGLSRGGRRPTMIGFCDDVFALVGVEIGASHVTVVVTDLRADVRADRWGLYPVRTDPDGAIAHGAPVHRREPARPSASRAARSSASASASPAACAPTPPGACRRSSCPPGATTTSRRSSSRAYGLPVFVENDANLGALAEQWWGAGRNGKDLTYIKIGTSIGSGHIINGELYRGAGGTAGEIGHLPMDPAGRRCPCGLTGCLTTFIGSETLVARAQREVVGQGRIRTSATRARRARGRRRRRSRIVADVGAHLGVAVASLMNVLNPAVVVLGGEITGRGRAPAAPVRAAVRERSLATTFEDTGIITSNLGDKAIAVGGATMVLRAALSDRALFPAGGPGGGGLTEGPRFPPGARAVFQCERRARRSRWRP